VLPVCDAMSADDNGKQKALLDRRVAKLAKLGQRGYAVREALGEDGVGQFDTDTDTDSDTDSDTDTGTDTDTDSLADAAQANHLFSLFLQLHLASPVPWQTTLKAGR
jgi:hypothetical protein